MSFLVIYPKPYKTHTPRAKGFGLLEALVAMVLLSSVGITLLAWVHQNLNTVQRIRGVYQEQEARRITLDVMRAVNPMDTVNGEMKRGPLRIVWQSEVIGLPLTQTGYPQGMGLHQITLYKSTVSVFRDDETSAWFNEEMQLIGYRPTSTLSGPF